MFALLGSTIVAGVGSSNSGVPGKADLVVFGVLLLVAASYVHRLGRGSTTAIKRAVGGDGGARPAPSGSASSGRDG